MLGAIALQAAEVVGIAEFRAQHLQDPEVFRRGLGTRGARQVRAKIRRYRVIVEKCVVDVEQNHHSHILAR